MKSTKKLTEEIFVQRSNDAHNNFYDYSSVDYKNCSTKVEIICPTHGRFDQKPGDHLRGIGCPVCGIYKNTRKKTLDLFMKEAKKHHGEFYDYSKVEYTNSKEKITIECPIHGDFTQTPSAHINGQGCPKCGDSKNRPKKDTLNFIERSEKIHGGKYDYSLVNYNGNKKKVDIICPIHGKFSQIPNGHLRGAGCWECSVIDRIDKKRLGLNDFITKANKIHNNEYDYSLSNYNRSKDKIDVICKKHGVFTPTVGNHLSGSKCPKCAAHISKSEIKIQSLLDGIGVEYIQHDRSLINPFELDFTISSHKIAIEFNGIYYHSEDNGGKDRKYHLNKTERCKREGYQLIHIFENEYLQKYDIMKFKIRSLFGKNRYKIFARKCVISEISSTVKKKFNEKYHIQGDSQSCINLGVFYKNRLVQVMTFSKRRKALGATHAEGEYELSRMSSIKGFTIVGGASKLLSHFENNYHPQKLVSYADRRWSKGDVYHKLGFKFIRMTPPNYWYFTKNNLHKPLMHRYKFAKHTLSKHLKNFDPILTEWENMKNHSYDRIWDSGSLYFEKVYT